jgi:hypothetical protein
VYIPFHKVKVPPDNLRRAFRALVLALISFVVFLGGRLSGYSQVEYYAFQTSLVALMLYVTLAVPFLMLAIGVLLSPMVVYLWLDSPSFPMLYQWWFWLHILVALLGGGSLVAVAGRRYPKRDDY